MVKLISKWPKVAGGFLCISLARNIKGKFLWQYLTKITITTQPQGEKKVIFNFSDLAY